MLAGLKLFAARGFTRTSVDEICREAGTGAQNLYHHFKDKQGLLEAVLRTYRDGLWALAIEPATRNAEGPLEKVTALMAFYRRVLMETGFRYGCPITALTMELTTPGESVRGLISEVFQAWRRPVEVWLAEMEGWSGVAARDGAAMALAAMQGGVAQARAARDIHPYDAAVEGLVRVLARPSRL